MKTPEYNPKKESTEKKSKFPDPDASGQRFSKILLYNNLREFPLTEEEMKEVAHYGRTLTKKEKAAKNKENLK
ncbi:MAG: hypothetical protein V4439_00380 [Patescibacteria group bacterium]